MYFAALCAATCILPNTTENKQNWNASKYSNVGPITCAMFGCVKIYNMILLVVMFFIVYTHARVHGHSVCCGGLRDLEKNETIVIS